MNAKVTYEMSNQPHPWSEEKRKAGIKAWCLCRVTKTESGHRIGWEPVAIFNLDSEAETFQRHIFEGGFDGKLVDVDREIRQLFELQARR